MNETQTLLIISFSTISETQVRRQAKKSNKKCWKSQKIIEDGDEKYHISVTWPLCFQQMCTIDMHVVLSTEF